jgi:para-nitrobenzyl esterase
MRRKVLGLTALVALSVSAAAEPTGVVRISDGEVRGTVVDGVARFLGIPYAAPPVGELRWRPPQVVDRWSGTLQAAAFRGTCAQPQSGVFAAPSNTEDCLYLNVYTPDVKPDAATRPVMVWFHGGGLFSGESNDYDGTKLAKRGGVVVVTLNYRVGALGFLSHPALNGEGHPAVNYGIMDQQAALKWMQRNIAQFGGDPGNVTIFGQSGGGTAVMANMQSPLSKGLFHKAINQSGTRIGVTPPEVMLKLGQEFAAAAGCGDQTAQCLRSLTVEQVLKHQGGILSKVVDFPSVDGIVITSPALAAFSQGAYNRVPIMTGLVKDEQAFFLPELNTKKPLTDEEYKRYAATYGAEHAEALLKKYPVETYGTPSLAEIAMAQGAKACTARLLDMAWSKHATVYAYQFEDRTAPSYSPAVSYPMRAYHTAELQYLFPLFRGGQGTSHPLSPEQERLSDIIVDYWTAFARTGDPNGKGEGAPPRWEPYSTDKDNVQSLDQPAPRIALGYRASNDCTLWDRVLSYR